VLAVGLLGGLMMVWLNPGIDPTGPAEPARPIMPHPNSVVLSTYLGTGFPPIRQVNDT
jgi:hypothetical protein